MYYIIFSTVVGDLCDTMKLYIYINLFILIHHDLNF